MGNPAPTLGLPAARLTAAQARTLYQSVVAPVFSKAGGRGGAGPQKPLRGPTCLGLGRLDVHMLGRVSADNIWGQGQAAAGASLVPGALRPVRQARACHPAFQLPPPGPQPNCRRPCPCQASRRAWWRRSGGATRAPRLKRCGRRRWRGCAAWWRWVVLCSAGGAVGAALAECGAGLPGCCQGRGWKSLSLAGMEIRALGHCYHAPIPATEGGDGMRWMGERVAGQERQR